MFPCDHEYLSRTPTSRGSNCRACGVRVRDRLFCVSYDSGRPGHIRLFRHEPGSCRSRISLAMFRERRKHFEHRVALLDGKYLDLDLLEERARYLLNIVHEDEIMILNP